MKPNDKPQSQDAISLLQADHDAVSDLFAAYEGTQSAHDKRALVAEICAALSVHAQIQEEIFYPEVQAVLKTRLQIPPAGAERAGVRELIEHLEQGRPCCEAYDAKMRALAQQVQHRVQAQRRGMFPLAANSSLDLDEVGARMSARRQDLLAQAA
jgi:hypothetical protein